jgi:hypothetical protein
MNLPALSKSRNPRFETLSFGDRDCQMRKAPPIRRSSSATGVLPERIFEPKAAILPPLDSLSSRCTSFLQETIWNQ